MIIFNEDDTFNTDLSENKTIKVIFSEDSSADVAFGDGENLTCGFSANDQIDISFSEGVTHGDYEGKYEATPTRETQILATAGKTLAHNVIIDPIPSNYGLVTWNGVKLTIS